MTAPVRVLPFGQHALLVELAGLPEVHRLWRALWDARDAGDPALRAVEEIVPGARTVLIVGRPGQLDLAALGHELPGRAARAGPVRGAGPGGPAELVVPVVYDGPDLDEVARLTGLSPAGVVERHSRAAYTVAFLGFAPGFAYLDGLDPGLAVPRREEPRPSVPAGSVAVAGAMSAVYPAAMPGGWQLIGRTGTVLFDPARTPPALLGPGDRVRFTPVDRLPVPPPGGGAGATGGPPGAGPGPVVEVLRPGPRTTVQDRGRVGHGHEGVPRAGAVDAPSLAVANELVGNPPGSAALETTLAGPALRFPGGALVGVAGADAPATIDGVPVAAWPAPVPPGGVLDVGTARRGLRCYIAVAGGLAVPAVLGSRSADTLSGLGPPPLGRGDVLPLGLPLRLPAPEAPTRAAPPAALPGVADEVEVLVHPGPRADRLGPGGLTGLGRLDLRVSPVSDRTGLRLEGDALPPPAGEPLPSEGMVPGAVQLPPGGHPIVLLCNHAVTGGYPVVAVVADRDLPVLAQSRPGTRVRLRPVG